MSFSTITQFNLIQIFSYLPPLDIVKCELINKHWKSTVNLDYIWKEYFEDLGIACLNTGENESFRKRFFRQQAAAFRFQRNDSFKCKIFNRQRRIYHHMKSCGFLNPKTLVGMVSVAPNFNTSIFTLDLDSFCVKELGILPTAGLNGLVKDSQLVVSTVFGQLYYKDLSKELPFTCLPFKYQQGTGAHHNLEIDIRANLLACTIASPVVATNADTEVCVMLYQLETRKGKEYNFGACHVTSLLIIDEYLVFVGLKQGDFTKLFLIDFRLDKPVEILCFQKRDTTKIHRLSEHTIIFSLKEMSELHVYDFKQNRLKKTILLGFMPFDLEVLTERTVVVTNAKSSFGNHHILDLESGENQFTSLSPHIKNTGINCKLYLKAGLVAYDFNSETAKTHWIMLQNFLEKPGEINRYLN